MNDKPVELLWTGGLDSTYRLLNLALVQHRSVQPHYLIDTARRSTAMELCAREAIQRAVRRDSAEAASLIMPTRFHSVVDLKPNELLNKCYDDVQSRLGMGDQHLLLALLADQLDLDHLEICNHRFDPAITAIEPLLVEVPLPDGSVYHRIPDTCENRAAYELFKYFRFPLASWDKRQLLALADQQGLAGYLKLTWFCHAPLGIDPNRAVPCGTCNTCLYRINTAGTDGFPFRSLLRYQIARVRRPRRMAAIKRRQGLAK